MDKKWQEPKNQELLKNMIKTFGEWKHIQVVDYDGVDKYFKVKTEYIITNGVKAQDLLNGNLDEKYAIQITQKEFQEKT